MNKQTKNLLVSGLLTLVFLPIIAVGFLWNELKGAFQIGEQLSELLSEIYERWFHGNS